MTTAQALSSTPATDQQMALAQHLGIDESTIEARFCSGPIHLYVAGKQMYYVAPANQMLSSDTVSTYKSVPWTILAEDPTQPYVRFVDEKVKAQLERLAPPGFTLLALNQQAHRVLFRDEKGKLATWAYLAHCPEEIASYHLTGLTADMLSSMIYLFKSQYTFKPEDNTVYCSDGERQ